ncbi:MAG: tetratricopeptide repeat protein [Isosphaeraceae bacterium]
MNADVRPTDDGRRVDSPARRIDAACDRFEAAWRAGQGPRIEDVLAGAEAADRRALLRELLALEVELRRGRAERATPADYRERFPGHGDVIDAAFAATGTRPGISRPGPSREPTDTGRNLLFGLLALQNNFVSRESLQTAFTAWIADRSRPLGRVLRDLGALDECRHALLEALIAEHLKLHGDAPERTLAALGSIGAICDELRCINDTDLQASLDATRSCPGESNGDGHSAAGDASSSRRGGERYRILRFHREGGLGRVYIARDEELGREVALKEIRPDKAAEAELHGRFLLEAEINGGLEHPGIVPVYSLGTYDDGRPFYAMRLVEGVSLKEAIERYHREHPRPDPSAMEFRKLLGRFIDVCEAIAFAHSKGVLHRDLKPHNVMLGRYGETLLIDWGLAKAIGRHDPTGAEGAVGYTLVPPSGSGHALTLGVLGSPPYMSPEQAAGATESLGPATDVYGLGGILFALLTGEPPVEGKTTEEVLDQVRRGAVRSPRSLNPSIPGALEAVCLKALANEPRHRYPTALELAGDVEHWLADEPVSAWREPFAVRARRWARQHRTAVSVAVAALLAGVVGLAAVAGVQARANVRLKRANDETVYALEQSEESRRQAETITTFLVEALRSPDPTLDGEDIKVVDILDRAGRRLESSFGGTQASKAALLHALGETYYGLGLYDRATQLHARALAVRQAVLGPDHQDTLTTRDHLGNDHWCAGRYFEAVTWHQETLERREAVLGPEHPDTLTSRHNLGVAYRNAGRPAEAIAMEEKTVRLRERILGADDPETLRTVNTLAFAYKDAGRLADATSLLASNLERRARTLGPDHLDTLQSRSNLGVAYRDAGRFEEAIALFEATLERRVALLGAEHPHTLFSHHDLGVAYWCAGRYSEAIETLERVIRLREIRLGPVHAETIHSRNRLADALRAVGRHAAAIALQEETLRLGQDALGPDHPYTVHGLDILASGYEAVGRWEDSERLLRLLVARRRKTNAPDDPRLAGDLAALGRNLLKQSKWSEADSTLRESLAIFGRTMADDWRAFVARSELGGSLLGVGRFAEAEPLIVGGYEGLEERRSRIPAPLKSRLPEAAERVVRLYESWGKGDRAAAWKIRLEMPDLPADVFSRP